MDKRLHFIRRFSQITKEDKNTLGLKAANLGEMYNQGFPVPNGFVITPSAYYHFLTENKLDIKIKHLLSTTNFDHLHSLHQISSIIKKLISQATFSDGLILEIISSYQKLNEPLVAIKLSESFDEFQKSKFVQHSDSVLNVKGDAVLLENIKQIWASVFDSKEIFYRHNQKIEQLKTDTCLIIQQMVQSDKSGILYTVNPNNNDKANLLIKAVLGLGEYISQNDDECDLYEVSKLNLSILKKFVFYQKKKLIKAETLDKKVTLSPSVGKKQKISDEEIIKLSKLGLEIEKYYYFPQKIEWAFEKNKLFIVESLPLTTIKNPLVSDLVTNDLILKGVASSKGIACGPVKIILSQAEAEKVNTQDIVVIKEIKSSYLQIFKKASAVIIENSDKNIQILFNSNQLKLPCVSGVANATSILKQDQIVTVNGSKGEVYKGGLSIKANKYQTSSVNIKTATKLFANISDLKVSENIQKDEIDGVCILNADSIITKLGIHPKKLIRENIGNLLVDSLSGYLTKTCNLFDTKPVIYQISNLTTGDYLRLDGGSEFEQVEENPNMGLRGAFRHIHDPLSFKLELEAIKKTRDALAYKNLWISIPYVRTAEELIEIKKIINQTGLQRAVNFKIFMSIDIPSNIIILDRFINVGIDGVFINTNLLTSLLTGTDKSNVEIKAEITNNNEYLYWALERIIKTANSNSISSIISNDNLTNAEDLITNLISWGVSAICVIPDSIHQTKKILINEEKKFINNR
jgi:pyruvate,water dikinase